MEQEAQPQPSQLNPVPPENKSNMTPTLFVGVLVTALVVGVGVYLFLNKSSKQPETNNQLPSETVSQTTETPAANKNDFKSEVAQFTEAAPIGTYKLIVANYSEIDLRADSLLQNGLYYKDRESGKIYHTVFRDDCAEQKTVKLKLTEDVNSDKFFVYKKDGRYARDLQKVYFDEWQIDFSCANSYTLQILPGADPETFEPNIVTTFPVSQGNTLQGLYSRDSKTVFYGSEVLASADSETFRISENVSITSDRNHVYLWNEIIPGADPSSYTIVRDYSAAGRGTVYGKDKNNVFVDYCLLKGIDAASFSITWNQNLRKDEFVDRSGTFSIELEKNKTGVANSCNVIR